MSFDPQCLELHLPWDEVWGVLPRMLTRRGSLAHFGKISPGVVKSVIFVLLLGICTGGGAAAQENQPTTYAGFEGRKVSKVDIAASPVMNVEAFRPLLKQKAGEPFSMAAVRDSVDALKKTNLFSQVQVEVQQDQSGLRLLFLLQPSYYVGMVYFPGAKAFSYTRMLQAVN